MPEQVVKVNRWLLRQKPDILTQVIFSGSEFVLLPYNRVGLKRMFLVAPPKGIEVYHVVPEQSIKTDLFYTTREEDDSSRAYLSMVRLGEGEDNRDKLKSKLDRADVADLAIYPWLDNDASSIVFNRLCTTAGYSVLVGINPSSLLKQHPYFPEP